MHVLRVSKEVEFLLGSIGALQSLFISAYLYFGKKRSVTNLLLAGFFALITLRITKSLLWMYLDGVPDWFINLGFIAHLSTGPILFLYFLHYLSPRKWNPWHYAHFLPAGLLVPLLFFVDGDNFWYRGGYTALLYHQLGYTLASLLVVGAAFLKKTKGFVPLDKKDAIWTALLLFGAASIQLAYFSNYILALAPYSAGPILYGILIYPTVFYGVINPGLFREPKQRSKYHNIHLETIEFERAKSNILLKMNQEKPFLDDGFSLTKLSRLVSLPPYLTSHIINKGFGTHFSEFVNGYRVREAKAKLRSKMYQHIKISEIAGQCGFNSLSSFNIAFKKQTGTTPSKFKKRVDL